MNPPYIAEIAIRFDGVDLSSRAVYSPEVPFPRGNNVRNKKSFQSPSELEAYRVIMAEANAKLGDLIAKALATAP